MMNDYLLSQSAILFPVLFSAALCALFFRHARRFIQSKSRLASAAGLAAGLFTVELLTVRSTVGLDNTPAVSYYLVLTFDILFACLVVFPRRQSGQWLIGSAAALSTLIATGLIINNFYEYYPTVGAIFGNAVSTRSTVTQRTISYHAATKPIEQQLFASGVSKGSVTQAILPGTLSGLGARGGYIYTPPAYTDALFANIKFPVLLLLTGTPGNPVSWLQSNLFITTMNNFASHHSGITPIVAIVDHSGSFSNDTECLDSSRGNAETYLTADVPAFLKTHYRVSNNPANWGIGGYSEGGMCAAMLTLTHQNLFRHFLDMSGDPYPFLKSQSQTLSVLFDGSRTAQREHDIDWLLGHQKIDPQLTGQFAIGSGDSKSLVAKMRFTYRTATQHHVQSSLEIIQNQGHTFGFWSRAYSDALPQLSYYLGATDCVTGCSSPGT